MSDTTAGTVLVVDDDRDIREALVELLRGEGFVVHGASNGQLALAHEPRPRVVLLDLMMPVLDGRGYIRAMRARGERAHIVLMSAVSHLHAVCGEEGVPHALPKPFETEDVLQLVSRLVQVVP